VLTGFGRVELALSTVSSSEITFCTELHLPLGVRSGADMLTISLAAPLVKSGYAVAPSGSLNPAATSNSRRRAAVNVALKMITEHRRFTSSRINAGN